LQKGKRSDIIYRMNEKSEYTIKVTFDPKTQVFIAWSDAEDLRGLVVEAASIDEMMIEVEDALPFILEGNMKRKAGETVIAAYALARLSELGA
jgi:hypothetical protein